MSKKLENEIKAIQGRKRPSLEVLRELYIAHKNLTSQRGQRTRPEEDNYIAYTWGDYCKDVGINRVTASRWLRRFVPAELSETGKVTYLPPEKKEKKKSLDPIIKDFIREEIDRKFAEYEKEQAKKKEKT